MYTNFVKPLLPDRETKNNYYPIQSVSGNEAQKMYLEEVKNVLGAGKSILYTKKETPYIKRDHIIENNVNDKELFRAVQDNDVEKVKILLNIAPNKANLVDEFGWSLLMIACRANAEEIVKELIKRGANKNICDRAGHTALSLVRNTNKNLYHILLDNKIEEHIDTSSKNKSNGRVSTSTHKTKVETKKEYFCVICNKVFHDKIEHLSSTIHNIHASKGRKNTPAYKIPETNKGYQLLLRVGWKKESGLGRQESGQIYPIRTVQKNDRKGLGHNKKDFATKEVQNRSNNQNRRIIESNKRNERILEVKFRREFY